MRRLLTVAVVGTLSLAGCVPPPITWLKPGATPQSFAQDKLTCIQTANATVGGFTAVGTPLMLAVAADSNRQQKQQVFNTCMEAQGWTAQQQARRW